MGVKTMGSKLEKRKQGKCERCGEETELYDSPGWWENNNCDKCVGKMINGC